MKYHKRNELFLYTAIWVILFVAPILSLYMRTLTSTGTVFEWDELVHEWHMLAIYFVVFTIHNFIAAPLLVYRKRPWAYTVIVVALFAGTIAWNIYHRPDEPMPHEPTEQMANGDRPTPPQKPMGQPFDRQDGADGPRQEQAMDRPPRPDDGPPSFLGNHDLVAVLLLLSMIGINVYTKYYFRFTAERKHIEELEKQNMHHQLEYLKYQVNPHFFMNTLNNIHALVDIDPELAKTTIVELSKLMRFVLYEGAKAQVPLQREIDFIGNYIRLMRIRFDDVVKISYDINGNVPNKMVPPLIAITFVENAFKHGISYKHDSFVDVAFTCKENSLTFTCRNSKADSNDEHGGVGLENARRRLDLIYGNKHKLDIKEDNDTYSVTLTVPL